MKPIVEILDVRALPSSLLVGDLTLVASPPVAVAESTLPVIALSTAVSNSIVAPGEIFAIDVRIATSQPSTGLGVRLVFDARQVQAVGISNIMRDSLAGAQQQGDTVLLGWLAVDYDWNPNGVLFSASFRALPSFSLATFSFVSVSVPQGFSFSAPEFTVGSTPSVTSVPLSAPVQAGLVSNTQFIKADPEVVSQLMQGDSACSSQNLQTGSLPTPNLQGKSRLVASSTGQVSRAATTAIRTRVAFPLQTDEHDLALGIEWARLDAFFSALESPPDLWGRY